MNRDTLDSSGVFDLAASRLTVTFPDAGKRCVSMQGISEDHYVVELPSALINRLSARSPLGA
jgi:hypothetical protein